MSLPSRTRHGNGQARDRHRGQYGAARRLWRGRVRVPAGSKQVGLCLPPVPPPTVHSSSSVGTAAPEQIAISPWSFLSLASAGIFVI